jgi:1-acyl-sn-glycerol-3-phosphate acyltransferase
VWILRRVIELKVLRVSEGEEKIPESGAAIVIAPHLCEFDALLAPEFVTRAGRMPRIFSKASLWKVPVVKQAFNSGKLIPVERGTENAAKSLEIAKDALTDGDVVFIFPEGTTSKDPESWPMRTKTGAARLALMSGAPVIPILQDGAQFLSKERSEQQSNLPWYPKYHHGKKVVAHLKAFDPIDFSDIFAGRFDSPTSEQIDAVNARIEQTLTKLVEDSRGAKAPALWDAKLEKRLGDDADG